MTMDLLDLMDDVAAHALTVAKAIDATFTDVSVGFPPAKGRCVRVFYGGERNPERYPDDETFNSVLVGQAINVRGYWPVASTGVLEQRVIEGQMAAFAKNLRAAVLGDVGLSGDAVNGLKMHLAAAEQVTVAGVAYAALDAEIVVDYDEHSVTR